MTSYADMRPMPDDEVARQAWLQEVERAWAAERRAWNAGALVIVIVVGGLLLVGAVTVTLAVVRFVR